jgi:hypothetical protein
VYVVVPDAERFTEEPLQMVYVLPLVILKVGAAVTLTVTVAGVKLEQEVKVFVPITL